MKARNNERSPGMRVRCPMTTSTPRTRKVARIADARGYDRDQRERVHPRRPLESESPLL